MSWQTSSLPTGTPLLNGVACTDTQHCVAVGQGTIVVSSDGGSTWTYQPPPSAQTTLLGVACNAAGDCLAAGISPNPGAPYHAQLARSVDEGATWAAISLPSAMYGLGAVACPTTEFCVAVGASLIVSDDGGQTWVPRNVHGGMGALSAISCATATQCIAIGSNPAELFDPTAPALGISTVDGGQTWNRIVLPPESGTVQAISCSSDGTCHAGGPALTPDGAAVTERLSADGTWAPGVVPAGMSDIAGLDCHLGTDCVAVGLQGRQPLTAASTDAGQTWTPVEVPLS